MNPPVPIRIGVLAAHGRAPRAIAKDATALLQPHSTQPAQPAAFGEVLGDAIASQGAAPSRAGRELVPSRAAPAHTGENRPVPEAAPDDAPRDADGERLGSEQPPRPRRTAAADPRRAVASREGTETAEAAPAIAALLAGAEARARVPIRAGDDAGRNAARQGARGNLATAALLAASDGATPAAAHARRADPKTPVRREPQRSGEPAHPVEAATTSSKPPSLPLVAAPEPRSTALPATPATPAAAAPLPPTPQGVDVGGALLRSAAHLRIDAGPMGAVDLHLRLRDGALHLRVDGDAAHLVEARSGELTRALAGEGLRLASLEVPRPDGTSLQGQGGDPGQGRREGWQQAADARDAAGRAPATPARSAKPPVARGDSIDVEA